MCLVPHKERWKFIVRVIPNGVQPLWLGDAPAKCQVFMNSLSYLINKVGLPSSPKKTKRRSLSRVNLVKLFYINCHKINFFPNLNILFCFIKVEEVRKVFLIRNEDYTYKELRLQL